MNDLASTRLELPRAHQNLEGAFGPQPGHAFGQSKFLRGPQHAGSLAPPVGSRHKLRTGAPSDSGTDSGYSLATLESRVARLCHSEESIASLCNSQRPENVPRARFLAEVQRLNLDSS